MKKDQLIECGLIPPEKGKLLKFEEKNSMRNFIHFEVLEHEFIGKPLKKGARIIHVNYLIQLGKEIKGIKTLQIYDIENNKQELEKKQTKNLIRQQSATMNESEKKNLEAQYLH